MVITNEPRVYRERSQGIRTENTMLVVEDIKNEFGEFYKFDVIWYCPIDKEGIDVTLLTHLELDWINNYYKMVFEKLSPYLDEYEMKFLESETLEIFR